MRTWGKACFVGEGGDVTLDVSPDLLRRQVTLIGSWTFSTVGQAECARYIADRGVDVDKLFTAPLEAGPGRGGLRAVRPADIPARA